MTKKEKRFIELGNMIDSLDDADKDFIFWLLLQRYKDRMETERDEFRNNIRGRDPTKEEMYEDFTRYEILRMVSIMRELLDYDLF